MTSSHFYVVTYERYIEHVLDDYLESLVKDDSFHTYEIGEYYPHMLGYCPRKSYYEYVYGPRLDGKGVRYVNLGITLHDFILRGFEKRGYQIEVPFEFRITPEVRIRGRIDGLAVDHILELKTTSYLPKKPHIGHLAQVSLYMKAFNRPEAYILYVVRNDLSRRVFQVPFQQEYYDLAVRTALQVHEALKTGVPPPRAPLESWECKTCPFREICERDG